MSAVDAAPAEGPAARTPPVAAGPGGPAALGADVAHFVEDVGMFFDANGLPRAAGRMLGWLLVCDPPHQSADALATALQASSGGVSQNARLLMQAGYVDRIGISGDRRSYYRVRPHAWSRMLDESQARTARLRELAEEGLAALAGTGEEHRRRLTEMRELFAFVEREFPALVRRYHEQTGE